MHSFLKETFFFWPPCAGWYLLPLSPAAEPSKACKDVEACKAVDEEKETDGEGSAVVAQLAAHS